MSGRSTDDPIKRIRAKSGAASDQCVATTQSRFLNDGGLDFTVYGSGLHLKGRHSYWFPVLGKSSQFRSTFPASPDTKMQTLEDICNDPNATGNPRIPHCTARPASCKTYDADILLQANCNLPGLERLFQTPSLLLELPDMLVSSLGQLAIF